MIDIGIWINRLGFNSRNTFPWFTMFVNFDLDVCGVCLGMDS